MTTEEKIRWLAEQAGWLLPDPGVQHGYPPGGLDCVALPDYPHSLDAIARDLLPILREKGWDYSLSWDGYDHRFFVRPLASPQSIGFGNGDSPASAAFEAIFEALHGATE